MRYPLAAAGVLLAAVLALPVSAQSLGEALRSADPAQVRAALAQGADPNALTEEGAFPLTTACSQGSPALVSLLLEAGAEVDVSPEIAETPLYVAAFYGNADCLSLLLQHGATTGAPVTMTGQTALAVAAEGIEPEAVALLLSHGASVADTDDNGCTPLMLASQGRYYSADQPWRQLRVLDLLLSYGSGLEAADNQGRTALFHAVTGACLSAVDYLLSHQALASVSDAEGITPLMLAVDQERTEIASLLLAYGSDLQARDQLGRTALIWAAQAGRVANVALLMDRGAQFSYSGQPATDLKLAAILGDAAALQRWLAAGINPDLSLPGDARTPLYWASWRGHADIVQMLLSKGAKAFQNAEYDPLQVAAGTGQLEVIRLLLPLLPEDRRSQILDYALAAAATSGSEDVVGLLLQQGANPNADTPQGVALSLAAAEGDVAIAERLLQAGADVQTADPLSAAAFGGYVEMVRLLLEHGAQINSDGVYYGMMASGPTPSLQALLGPAVGKWLVEQAREQLAAAESTDDLWQALGGLERAQNCLPEDIGITYNRALVEDQLGSAYSALEHYRAYLAAVSDGAEAAYARERVAALEAQ